MLRRAMKAKQAGFTLLELMFTIVIMGLLLGLSVPSFRDFLRNSRLTSSANDLLADISVARTEAIKRRQIVTLCGTTAPQDDTPACVSANANGFNAWVVFVDEDGDGAVASESDVLRRHEALPAGVTSRSNGGFISYADTGFLRPIGTDASATRFFFCDSRGNATTAGGLSAARALTLLPTGRAGINRRVSDIAADLSAASISCP
jgi:type IV fimbrial biogenesis protein FimT